MLTYLSLRGAGSCLNLEVITGPSSGLRYSVQSTIPSKLPLTLGRISPSDLLIQDLEVSGKHALINWNLEVNHLLICWPLGLCVCRIYTGYINYC